MRTEALTLHGIPALLYGEPCDRAFLHVHGKMGCKEEAERFAELACPRGWQVLSMDLPEHGARKGAPASGRCSWTGWRRAPGRRHSGRTAEPWMNQWKFLTAI